MEEEEEQEEQEEKITCQRGEVKTADEQMALRRRLHDDTCYKNND